MADDKSLLQRFAERWFAPAALMISGIAGGLSYYASGEAQNAKQIADQAKAVSEAAMVEREYAFRVTGLVLTTISDPDPRKQGALGVLVDTVDPQYKDKLRTLLERAATPQVREETIATTAFDRQDKVDDIRKGEASTALRTVAPTAKPIAGTVQLAGYKENGWDVDVFYCQGGEQETARHERANRFANALVERTRSAGRLDNILIGRVRVRAISAVINSRPSYRISDDVVRPENGKKDEEAVGMALQTFAKSLSLDLRKSPSGSPTNWYISAFFCR